MNRHPNARTNRATGAGPRFSAKTEGTIEWFCARITTLTNRNAWLWREMIFYRSVCRFLTGVIVVELIAVFVAFLWSLS